MPCVPFRDGVVCFNPVKEVCLPNGRKMRYEMSSFCGPTFVKANGDAYDILKIPWLWWALFEDNERGGPHPKPVRYRVYEKLYGQREVFVEARTSVEAARKGAKALRLPLEDVHWNEDRPIELKPR